MVRHGPVLLLCRGFARLFTSLSVIMRAILLVGVREKLEDVVQVSELLRGYGGHTEGVRTIPMSY